MFLKLLGKNHPEDVDHDDLVHSPPAKKFRPDTSQCVCVCVFVCACVHMICLVLPHF